MNWESLLSGAGDALGSIGGAAIKAGSSQQTSVGPSSGTQSGTIIKSGYNSDIMSMLQNILTDGSYTKSAAINDASTASTAAMQEVLQNLMPSIAGATKQAGMSNGSMTEALSNQAANQASYAGGKLKIDAISQYSDNIAKLLSALAQGQATTETRDLKTTESGHTETQSGGMCWITTLVCDFYGHDDDCSILRTLREFRDGYMKDHESPERNAMVAEYYASAELYEHTLDCMSDGAKILHYSKFMNSYILPAVNAIKAYKWEEALTLYTAMFNDVKALHASITQY